jgi:hypothetical protein
VQKRIVNFELDIDVDVDVDVDVDAQALRNASCLLYFPSTNTTHSIMF